ncbi:MAG TPA: hypothetical protein VFK36_11880 [Gemmatimonadales bacterium]|nr:hypothetical protein [Gemmatimonadales bacterium]
MAVRFFRFVHGESPRLEDFMPQGALGKAMRIPGDQRAWDHGVSVYDDFEAACAVAARIRYGPGSYIAAISLPEGHGLEVVQTGRDEHHYTIYAEADVLLGYVNAPAVRMPRAPVAKE